jgi:hypothetical protein
MVKHIHQLVQRIWNMQKLRCVRLSQSLLLLGYYPLSSLVAFCLCCKFTKFFSKTQTPLLLSTWLLLNDLAQRSNSSMKSFSVEREAMYFSQKCNCFESLQFSLGMRELHLFSRYFNFTEKFPLEALA